MWKKYGVLLISFALQTALFYLLPLLAGPTDAIGMVVVLLLGAVVFGLLSGLSTDSALRLAYPPAISAAFFPSIFLYYNFSAMIHVLWYLVAGYIGVILGMLLRLCLKPLISRLF